MGKADQWVKEGLASVNLALLSRLDHCMVCAILSTYAFHCDTSLHAREAC